MTPGGPRSTVVHLRTKHHGTPTMRTLHYLIIVGSWRRLFLLARLAAAWKGVLPSYRTHAVDTPSRYQGARPLGHSFAIRVTFVDRALEGDRGAARGRS